MPVEGINGILNVESAALHAPQVGVANTNPQHILSVGSNLYVSGDSPDVLTVDGNVVCEGVKVGLIEIIPSYDLEAVANVGNSTSNTIRFTNPDTGIVATGNVSVGKTLTVDGIRITAAAEADVDLDAVVAAGSNTGRSIQLQGDTDSTGPYTGTLTIGTSIDAFGGLGVAGNVHVGRGLFVDTDTLVVDSTNNRVGIGKTNPDATLDVDGDAIIRGDLSVLGTTTTIDTDNLRVQDPIIELGKDNAGTGDLGLVMTRPSGSSNVAVIFDEDRDTLEIGYTNGGASDTTITMDLAPLSVNVNGNLSVTSNLEVGTANLFVDTTNSRVGVGTSIPTESLDVVGNMNLQQVSNTASIKLNSNVVTEFPRSKKLIKYPRVALTSAALNSAYENGYRVTFSNENTAYRAWEAFDANPGDDVGWHSQGPGASAEYNGTGGLYSGTSRLATETELGEWLGLELPEAIKLIDVNMVSQSYSPTTNTIDNFVVYAKKQSGDTWTSLGVFTGVAAAQNSAAGVTVNVDANDYYKFFAIVATKRDSAGVGTGVSIRDLAFFGVPEYDPEADGVDVVVKSVPNVPNTDWLEVYYDAKDLADGALSTTSGAITGLGGTTINGTAFGDPQVSNGAFVFDGSGDYIESLNITSLSENQILSTSVWVKFNSWTNANVDLVFSLGDRTGGTGKEYGLAAYHSGTSAPTSGLYVSIYGYDSIKSEVIPDLNKWYHFVTTHDGSTHQIFINGVLVKSGVTGGNVNLPTSGCDLVLGGDTSASRSQFMNGKIANFRLFNRALTSDEIYQLYAYQKEYFGHGVLGMTLKAGRLGIGTSEPKADLDVRGVIKGTGALTTGLPWFYARNQTALTTGSTSYNVTSTHLQESNDVLGTMYSTSYACLFPIKGIYIFSAQVHSVFGSAHNATFDGVVRYSNGSQYYKVYSPTKIGATDGNFDTHSSCIFIITTNADNMYLDINHITSASVQRNYSGQWNRNWGVCIYAL
jgi:hypothetical protein